jgi:AcrR family transcriptional regulator
MPDRPAPASQNPTARPTRRTQAERRNESERRILEAAVLTIGQKGSAQTSLAEIGEIAGYSRGLPAHLFGSKQNLIFKTVQSLMLSPPNNTLFAEQPGGGINEMLKMLENWFLIASDHPDMTRGFLVLWSEGLTGDVATRSPELYGVLQTIDNAGRLRMREFLQNANARGELRPGIDLDAQPVIIIGAVLGILWQWYITPAAIDLTKTARSYIQGLSRTLTGTMDKI